MSSLRSILSNGDVTFINKPVADHNWIVIRQDDRSYVFYDPQVISLKNARLYYYAGTRAGLFQAVQEWTQLAKEEHNAR